MADKKQLTNLQPNEDIVEYNFEDLMGDRFGRYAKYIIQERALPDVRDGLKPVQRRILYGMKMLKLGYDKPYMKSARIVGDVMGKYHPHGDSSIYEALVRMSQTWKMGLPLVDMQGNNGSMDGDPAAAYRYTESRLQKASDYLLADLDKNAVEFAPNYDDKDVEPTVLPAYFPNILVNGSTGIAAGYATNMPPHNLTEVIDATIAMIKNPKISVDELLTIIPGPDFPTGGTLQQLNGVKDAFSTGKGKVVINSKWHTEKEALIIDQIPYEVIKQDLVRKIGEVSDNNPGLGIKDIIDESDKTGLRITIKLAKDANLETVRKFLFKNTPLSVSYNYNNVVIINKQPKQVGIIEILKAYLNHYTDVYLRKTKFELDKSSKRLEIIDGLVNAMSILDEVIAIIRRSENRKDAINNLVTELEFVNVAIVDKNEVNLNNQQKTKFTVTQAEAIVDMRLYRLTSTDVVALKQEKIDLEAAIKRFNRLIDDKKFLNNTIIENLKKIKAEYSIPRRSELSETDESFEVNIKDTITQRKYQLFISLDGYIKAVDPILFEKNDLATFGRKPNDLFITNFEVSNMDHLILISSAGLFYSIPLFKVGVSKWRDLGMHVNDFASMNGDRETIIGAIAIPDFTNLEQQLLVTTKKGMIKRVLLSELETKTFNKSFRLIRLDDKNDELVSASLVDKNSRSAVVINNQGYGVQYDLNDIPIQKANSKGVKATTSRDDLVAGISLTNEDNILLLTTNDHWKKVKQSDVPMFIRPKKGTKLYTDATKKTKELVKFAFGINQNSVLTAINYDNEIQNFDLKNLKLSDLEDKTSSMNFNNLAYATLLNNYVANNEEKLSSTSDYLTNLDQENDDTMVKKMVKKEPKKVDKLKEKEIKANIEKKYAQNDLYSMFDNFNHSSNNQVEEPENDDTDQLNFDDLMDD